MFRATGLYGWQPAAGVSPATELTREQQVAALKQQAQAFEGVLGELRQRIEALGGKETEA